ncbi:Hypothetical protein ETEE_0882 [Edwardsiella anguillarum ET080813]|uniref:Uncharacterized protein n=1 Tax=Edwardsiella anguillarum ET080813 TaxID=667120 RepID=A0A076LGY8_9GAMM|nr:Hypothetical protein ETEE_0882 [Edwardsiella anguillarum ET080813]
MSLAPVAGAPFVAPQGAAPGVTLCLYSEFCRRRSQGAAESEKSC